MKLKSLIFILLLALGASALHATEISDKIPAYCITYPTDSSYEIHLVNHPNFFSNNDKKFEIKYSKATKSLKDLIETANTTAKQLIQTESTNFFDLYTKISDLLIDAKKPQSDSISNLKMLMTSSRNRDGAALLEQQHGQWKIFLEIMKNYAIIGSVESK